MDMEIINKCSGQIVDAGMRVHTILGPGLVESVYEGCLACELRKRGFSVQRQLELPVRYDGVTLEDRYRLDLLVDDLVVVEVKAAAKIAPIHEAILMTYLRLSGHRLGLILNFHEVHLRNGIRRIINGY